MRLRIRPQGLTRADPEAGYTLTEMLVVIGIIGLIAAVLTPNIINQFARAKAKAAQLQLDTLATNIETFSSDTGRYPSQAEGLTVLVNEPGSAEGWTGPYVRDPNVLKDPWGHPIIYVLDPNAHTFAVVSLGADGKQGGKGVDRDLQSPMARSVATGTPPAAP